METNFNKIIEEIEAHGIKVIKVIKTNPNSWQTYRIIGTGFDSDKTWKAWQIITAYQRDGLYFQGKEYWKEFDRRIKPGTKVLLLGRDWRVVKSIHPTRKWIEVEGFLGGFHRGHVLKFSNRKFINLGKFQIA